MCIACLRAECGGSSRISARLFLKRNTSRMQTALFSPSSPRRNLHFPMPRCQGLEEKSALALQNFPNSQGKRGNRATLAKCLQDQVSFFVINKTNDPLLCSFCHFQSAFSNIMCHLIPTTILLGDQDRNHFSCFTDEDTET